KLGEGGMGVVLRVRDPSFERTLAVKVMLPRAANHPGADKRFLEEARITGQLQHPGIPPVHELGRLEDGLPFFTMKLIKGRTLSETGDSLGTPGYLAPEQARGEIRSLDERCDVFGLGALLCEILTGAPPFRGKSRLDRVRQAADGNLADALQRLDECAADAAL